MTRLLQHLTVGVAASLGCACLIGCGGSGGPPAQSLADANKPASREALKKQLSEIAESGVTGSATEGLRPAIEEIKATDAKLGDELLADLAKLETATTPAAVKTTAGAMAGKL